MLTIKMKGSLYLLRIGEIAYPWEGRRVFISRERKSIVISQEWQALCHFEGAQALCHFEGAQATEKSD